MQPARARVAISIFDDVDNPHYGGGGAVVVGQIAARLAQDHQVTVYTAGYRGSGREQLRDGVRYRFLPIGWAGPRGGQLLFLLLLPLVALRHRPQLWIESLTPPVSASPLPLVARCPVVGLVQMLAGADMGRRYKLPFAAVERLGLRIYRHFVVLNDTDREAVRAANPRASITLIPNGIERPSGDEIEYGTGDHVLFLGRIDVRQKGLDLLLAAAERELGLPVVIAGAGTRQEEARLRALLPDGDRVRVVGRVAGAEKADLLRRCAVMVVPSRYETFCLSALEAMSYGKPVVHFALPQLGWIGPGAGIAVPAFEVAELAAAVTAVVADEDLRIRLGRGARERSADYDREATGARYQQLAASLLAA
jgi:glycosyltransferase involved in cell wall biosynthesis